MNLHISRPLGILSRQGLPSFQSTVLFNRLRILLLLCIAFSFYQKASAQSFVNEHGDLSVQGVHIINKKGEAVQLRGMSLFWSQWRGDFYNFETVKWLRDDWKANIIRTAMAVEHGGYAKNPTAEKEKVFAVIDAAIDLGMYVVVDFHAHEAQHYTKESKRFFKEVAKKYGHYPNIIYEIWNEPLDVSWSEVIKPYHESIIKTIRKYDPDNIVICGTRSWSQRVDEAAEDPVPGRNIAYTLHFYSGTHKQDLRDIAQQAIDKGIALFVTEYGTTNADGDGPVDEEETKIWWEFLDKNKISHCNWSVSDKQENSAALFKGADVKGGWSEDQLQPGGRFVRSELRAKNSTVAASEKEPVRE